MFKSSHAYGATLNSYDVLKLVALLSMVIDHLGVYFWPQAEWLRGIGRIAFPLFLFLVGYSGVWKFRADLIIWAALIIACAALTHHPIFSLNILVTIALVRVVMMWLSKRKFAPKFAAGIFIVCLVWWPLFLWTDYSTIAVLFAVSGLLQRRQPKAILTQVFLYTTLTLHLIIEYWDFQFHLTAAVIMVSGVVFIAWLMRSFTLRNYNMGNRLLQWAARNTLPLYALHVMLFMALEYWWFPERLAQFKWF